MRPDRSPRIASVIACLLVAPTMAVSALAQPAPSGQEPGSAGQAASLSAQLAAIESKIDTQRQALHIPGVALVIVKDDKIIDLKGFGLRDVAQKLPVTPETLFAIGSSSKAFTAMTVLMSVDDGKMRLDDSPRKYLPYFKLRDPDTDSHLTVSDLLCHRSGLDRTDLIWAPGVLRRDEVIRAAAFVKPTAKLGEKFQYQNVMFLTAGECVAKAQHASWESVVARRIFTPLGMDATGTSIKVMQRAPDHALGYRYDEVTKAFVVLPMRDLTCIAPAGAINSNVKDMARWVRLMLSDGVYAGKRLVSEPGFAALTATHMHVGGKTDYGYGWFLHDWNGHKVVEHGGNIDGFNAQVALMPDQKLGFVLLTNVSASPLGAVAMESVWTNLVGGAQKPAETKAAAAPAADPAQEVGSYELAAAHLTIEVTSKEGKLQAVVPGQPTYPLENIGGRRYKLSDPAPPGFFCTFRPAKDNPTQTEMFLEQPQGNVTLVKKSASDAPKAFTAPISVEELMQKVIAAAGGEAGLRKHHAMIAKFAVAMETQGVTGEGTLYKRAPDALATMITLRALNKKLAASRDYCDGTRGGSESTLSPASVTTGKALIDARIDADFTPELDWKTLFKTVTITGMAKVDEEEVYVVKKVPEGGDPVTDYISTKTFLLRKRDTVIHIDELNADLPKSVVYRDYRPVDGVMVSFQHVVTDPTSGETALTLTDVTFDARIKDSVFLAHKR